MFYMAVNADVTSRNGEEIFQSNYDSHAPLRKCVFQESEQRADMLHTYVHSLTRARTVRLNSFKIFADRTNRPRDYIYEERYIEIPRSANFCPAYDCPPENIRIRDRFIFHFAAILSLRWR